MLHVCMVAAFCSSWCLEKEDRHGRRGSWGRRGWQSGLVCALAMREVYGPRSWGESSGKQTQRHGHSSVFRREPLGRGCEAERWSSLVGGCRRRSGLSEFRDSWLPAVTMNCPLCLGKIKDNSDMFHSKFPKPVTTNSLLIMCHLCLFTLRCHLWVCHGQGWSSTKCIYQGEREVCLGASRQLN